MKRKKPLNHKADFEYKNRREFKIPGDLFSAAAAVNSKLLFNIKFL